jgi:hypothetical protein
VILRIWQKKIPKNYLKFGLVYNNNKKTNKYPNNIQKLPKLPRFPKFLILKKTKFVERNPKTCKFSYIFNF